jgi:Tol biopolymer transport system component
MQSDARPPGVPGRATSDGRRPGLLGPGEQPVDAFAEVNGSRAAPADERVSREGRRMKDPACRPGRSRPRSRSGAGVRHVIIATPWRARAVGALSWAALLLANPTPAAVPGTTARVTVDSLGDEGNGFSYPGASVSSRGQVVAFASLASNLVPGDTNGTYDVFVHDLRTGTTARVSVDSAGVEGDSQSVEPSISADGRLVAFRSLATNLVPDDTNGTTDVFLHDRKTGTTTRVSVDSAGAEGNGQSFEASISDSGRFVAFSSEASNLVPDDTNGMTDVFLHDRKTGTTTRVSVDSAGIEGDGPSFDPSISADGRFVAFTSMASNLVPGDTPLSDVYVHDAKTGTTTRVSTDSAGLPGNSSSFMPSISDTGRFVAFASMASDLVPDDTNGAIDVFVHDLKTGATARASVDSAGIQGNGVSWEPSISGNGRAVAFHSEASNLVPGDTNASVATGDVFVHDLRTGDTIRVSVDSAGNEGNGVSFAPSISDNGRVVAFNSGASNLVPGDTNETADVFVHATGGGPARPSVGASPQKRTRTR